MKLLSDYPTRRTDEYRELYLKKPKDYKNKNYYSMGKFYFNKFKNKEAADVNITGQTPITKFFKKKSKDGVVLKIDDELKEYINLLRKLDRSRIYLIESNRKPYKLSTFSQYISKNFGLTVNEFRKRWV